MHGVIHRRLGIASNGNWIQEGLAPAVQVHLHPSALNRKKFAANFKKDGGWLRPWPDVLEKPGITTRDYPQTLSMMEYLQDRHREKLPAVWAAVRKLRGPVHSEAMPAIAGALGLEVIALERDWLAWGPAYYAR